MLLLKKHGPSTVARLSQQLGVTPNAVRQHLSALERDSLVTQRPVKIGPSKPALVYSLTADAEGLFPKHYGALLLGLVKEIVRREGETGARSWLGQLGHSFARSYVYPMSHLTIQDKLEAVGRILEENGSITEWEETRQGMRVRDFNCPYATAVMDHPEVCEVQRGFLQGLLGPAKVDIFCDHSNSRCEFHILSPHKG